MTTTWQVGLRTWQTGAMTAAALILAAAPVSAQEETGVSCEEARAGEQMTCTATGLEAGSTADWSASFDDGTEESDQDGTAEADEQGEAAFEVEVPDEPGADYEVEVTGTAEDGESEYQESTSGQVVASEDDDGAGLDCGEARAGEQMTCTATGLEAGSTADWSASFDDGTEESDQAGTAEADEQGEAAFEVEVPDEPGADYEVEVTGTAEDGESEYQESTSGQVGASEDGDGAGLDCGEARAGEQMTCTATGLEAGSTADWTATLDGEVEDEGQAPADEQGEAAFEVEVPDEPGADYEVQATGTAPDGGSYEESTTVVIAAADGDDADGEGTTDTEDTTDTTAQDTDDTTAAAEDDGTDGTDDEVLGESQEEDQVEETPKGGADTGLGGTAAGSGPGTSSLASVALAVLLAAAMGLALRRGQGRVDAVAVLRERSRG